MEEKLLTINELAEYLNISRRTVYRILDHQNLPAYRIGKHLRFKRDDIDQWIVDQKILETPKRTRIRNRSAKKK
jgi:excisionase family DNA binding protein